MEAVFNRLSLFLSDALIPTSFGCNTWKFRTEGERDYLDNLLTWSRGDPVVEADRLWHGQLMVTNDALSWTCPILPLNFRRLKRGNIPFFQHTVRFERKMRSDTGYFLAYQMVEAGEIARSHYINRYQQLPSWWGQFEVCQGFWAELGPILTYFGSHLNDPRHGLWVVFLTEWCVKVAATLLWEAYDCWRLWYLPPKLVEFMRLLDYTVPLGGADTDIELHSLLKKIDQVDWDTVPPINSSRSLTRRRPSFSSGRSHSAAGDFVWINPWTSALCSPSEARLSRQFGNQVPTPDVAPERAVDPRADDICPRPSAPNSPLPAAPAAPPATADVPSAGHTETLSVREVLSSPPSPSISKKSNGAVDIYCTLLRAHGLKGKALQGVPLEDLRVLARLVTSLPKEKSLDAPSP